MKKLHAWLKIIRLQFYPMTFLAYGVGTAAAKFVSGTFNAAIFFSGYLVLFLIELATVMTNEYFDYPSDKINRNAGMFTGGSQVLVRGELNFAEVRKAIFLTILLTVIAGSWLVMVAVLPTPGTIWILIVIGMFLGLGYTLPPFKFCYRGWGELVVGLTHSFYVILCGFIFQTGNWHTVFPYIISLPLFFAVSGAIILAGIPDYEADKIASKKTLTVILGPKRAAVLSIIMIFSAAVSALLILYFSGISCPAAGLIFPVAIHSFILVITVLKFIRSRDYNRRIDSLMQMALSYVIWFGILPLLCLLYGIKK